MVEVECLGACSNGPMIQINNDFYEDLDQESTKKIIENIKFLNINLNVILNQIFFVFYLKLESWNF